MNIDSSSAIFSDWQVHDAKDGGGKKELTANVKIGNNTYCITVNYNNAMADALRKQGPNAHKTLQKIIESSSPQINELVQAFEKTNRNQPTFMTLNAKPFAKDESGKLSFNTLASNEHQKKVDKLSSETDAKNQHASDSEINAANKLTIQINKMFNDVVKVPETEHKEGRSISTTNTGDRLETKQETKRSKRKSESSDTVNLEPRKQTKKAERKAAIKEKISDEVEL